MDFRHFGLWTLKMVQNGAIITATSEKHFITLQERIGNCNSMNMGGANNMYMMTSFMKTPMAPAWCSVPKIIILIFLFLHIFMYE